MGLEHEGIHGSEGWRSMSKREERARLPWMERRPNPLDGEKGNLISLDGEKEKSMAWVLWLSLDALKWGMK